MLRHCSALPARVTSGVRTNALIERELLADRWPAAFAANHLRGYPSLHLQGENAMRPALVWAMIRILWDPARVLQLYLQSTRCITSSSTE